MARAAAASLLFGILSIRAFASSAPSVGDGLPQLVIHAKEDALVLDLGDVLAGDERRFLVRWEADVGGVSEMVEGFHASCGCLKLDFRPDVSDADNPLTYSGHIRFSSHPVRPETLSQKLSFDTDRRKVVVTVTARIVPRPSFAPVPMRLSLDERESVLAVSREIPAGVVLASVDVDPAWKDRGLEVRISPEPESGRLELQMDAVRMREHVMRSARYFPWRETIRTSFRLAGTSPDERPAPPTPFLVELEYSGPVTTRPRVFDFGLLRSGEEAVLDVMVEGEALWLRNLAVKTPPHVRAILGAPTEGRSISLRLIKTVAPDQAPQGGGGSSFVREEVEISYGDKHTLHIPLHYVVRGNPTQQNKT